MNMRQTIVSGDEAMYKFTGKERDDGSNYDYFGVRYYDSSIGRWMAPDPSNQYHSPFVYCGNNPYIYVDKDGGFAFSILIPGAIGGTFGAVNAGVAAWRAADGNLSGKWGGFFKSVGVGFITGATAAYVPGGWGVIAAGVANTVQVATAEHFINGKTNWNNLGVNMALGFSGAFIAKYAPLIPGTFPGNRLTLNKALQPIPASFGENMVGATTAEILGARKIISYQQENTIFYNYKDISQRRMDVPTFEADIWNILVNDEDTSVQTHVEVEIEFNNSEPF